ncbi:MAG TPA: DPP IV N-terminal domain-containing protein, partial [Puia sp.]|nr:DPP IV N-terminal domain-containing protein [Puia sp.]
MRITILLCLFIACSASAQPGSTALKWSADGRSFYKVSEKAIVRVDLPDNRETVVVSSDLLRPVGHGRALEVRDFSFSADGKKVLVYTNAQRVWRYDTRGDYWVLDIPGRRLVQVGRERPAATLLFAKLSPDGSKVAYSSQHNLYIEDVGTGVARCVTSTEGTPKLINGTFDWAYEEELDCRDGFRWSPDGQHIAYWQIDANKIKDYLMLNTTDSTYPFVVPVEYPVAGEAPSPYRIGVIDVGTGTNRWMDIPGDPRQTYLPRMEWAANSTQLILQQLKRKQNESKLLISEVATGRTTEIYDERDSAYIDCKDVWQDGVIAGWDWLGGGKEFLWVTDKDGWRHVYRVSRDGRQETLVTRGNYDVMGISRVDEKDGWLYFMASPGNATQKYLYRTRLDGKGGAERVTPASESGTHEYDISPDGRCALHTYSNANMPERQEMVGLPGHASLARAVSGGEGKESPAPGSGAGGSVRPGNEVLFFGVKTADGVEMEGWMVRPAPFDASKKYP